MRTKTLFTFTIIIAVFLSAYGQSPDTIKAYQEFTIEKKGIQFPDGKTQREALVSTVTSVPELDDYKIYAICDIKGDVTDPNYLEAIQFYQIENLLSSQFDDRGDGPRPKGDPINNYFEAIKLPDKASIDLIDRFQGGDVINEIRFDIYGGSGLPSVLYRVTIYAVRIARVHHFIANIPNGTSPLIKFYEKYTFMFDEMRIEFPGDSGEFVSFLIYGNDY